MVSLAQAGYQIVAWVIALGWLTRTVAAARGLPTVPNLCDPLHDATPAGEPSITIIVPARNEAADIRATLESLLTQDYVNLKVIAVNDRSTDATGAEMDSLAAGHRDRLQVLHITELPPGWLGKTHAMAAAAALAQTDFLLFTDADILFAPSVIRRALACAVSSRADHLVLGPSTIIRRWDEGALLSFFQMSGFWSVRPWKVSDPRSRDAIGIGAFNLLRTSAYRRLGGFEALRMEIVEDFALGRRVKQAGLRQLFCFGPSLVRLHWASGADGIIGVMTKNIFAVFGYRIWYLLLGCLPLYLFFIHPFFGLTWAPLRIPSAISVLSLAVTYWLLSRYSTQRAWNFFFAPFAAALFIYALLRSMLVTLWQGGVQWRGTFYPLRELRKHRAPLFPPRT